ncbi:Slc34a2 [Symbiodinium natans]|uniref:Slc34a2 protein n=1 Tax=Symbiodinium natans TaxID=878477 RepID=A0A812J9X2_9DINO|nr:Slc34a2 [Symbiodinium natans]
MPTTDGADCADAKGPQHGPYRSFALTAWRVFGVFAALYCFLFGLDLMGVSFKALGGKGAGKLFTITENPISGLMVGILATVLVQSSSTSTSIVVGLVAAGQLDVHNAIPLVMGANIGTSVTNTIVSMAHVGERSELERAFSGATVHDMFNMLSVIVLLPLEVIVGAIQGEGGPIYWLSMGMADAIVSKSEVTFPSPIKAIVDPIVDHFMDPDKAVIKALSLGPPTAVPGNLDSHVEGSSSFCVSSAMHHAWAKVDEAVLSSWASCPQELCGEGARCLQNADSFYKEHIEGGEIIASGFLKPLGDVAGGAVALAISLLAICLALFCLVKLLHALVLGRAKTMILRATSMNDYLAMAVGAILTFVVQSSSVVTSALTPLCGLGLIMVEKMLPVTLGANIGTTCTALLAAVAELKHDGLQIAFCHLLFNIFGILVWFPVPSMRGVVIGAAKMLGFYASYWRMVPLLYIFVMFLVVPGAALGISLLFGASLAAGITTLVAAIAGLAAFLVWWNTGGCYRVVSRAEREARELEKKAAAHQAEADAVVNNVHNVDNLEGVAAEPVHRPERERSVAPCKAGHPEIFHDQVFTHYASVEAGAADILQALRRARRLLAIRIAAFATHAPADTAVLAEAEFRNWYATLVHLDRSPRLEDAAQLEAVLSKADFQANCRRLFSGLAKGDALSAGEIRQAFAEVAPPVLFSAIRRRILLGHISVAGLMSEVRRSPPEDGDEAEIATGSAGQTQAEKISELLEVSKAQVAEFLAAVTLPEQGAADRNRIKLPEDGTGFSLEEFAIVVFLCKPIEKNLEELIGELPPGERDRPLSFEEFQRYVVKDSDRPSLMRALPKAKAKASPAAKRQSAAVSMKPPGAKSAGLSSLGGILPAKCTAAELRIAYEALERPDQCVTVNSILNSLCNISDVLAIDRRNYQGGDRIVCRVRLGSELTPLSGKSPVLAVVPSRLLWCEDGKNGFWQLDGQKVKSFAQIGCIPHPLPAGSASMRDCVVWLTAPWNVSGHRAYDVRLLRSEHQRVPLKQVGSSVSFVLQPPQPPEPVVEKAFMQIGDTSCSVSVGVKPPLAAIYCPPIQKYILHIEPDPPARREVVEACAEGSATLKESIQTVNVQNLRCGVPYRFATQCVYQVTDQATSEIKEVHGARSELCAAQTTPVGPLPPDPGRPDVRLLPDTGQMEILEILLRVPDGAASGRPHHEVEYRKAGVEEWNRIDDSKLFFSHEHKWDEQLNSLVSSCLLMGLKPVLPERNGVEFRVRRANAAGLSAWSKPSGVLTLRTKEEEDDDAHPELQVTSLDVFSMVPAPLLPEGEGKPKEIGKRGLRTHCRLRWIEDCPDAKYQIEAREEKLPFHVHWSILPMYHRTETSNDQVYGEVLVSGLDQFPASEPLTLRVVKLSSRKAENSVRATLRISGVSGNSVPQTLELVRTLMAPGSKLPLAEVSWPAEKDSSLKGISYVFETSWELADPSQSRSDWKTLTAPTAVTQVENPNSPTGLVNLGFVYLQLPEEAEGTPRCWLRVRSQGNDGRLSDASPEAGVVQLADAIRGGEALRHISKGAPKRPKQLSIRTGNRKLWEVSWEQRGKLPSDVVYEAEVCFRTEAETQEDDWMPVRGLFLPRRQDDGGAEGGHVTTVTAAVTLMDDDVMPEEAWRLRVRAAGGNWSTPTAWQERDDGQEVLLHIGKPEVRHNACSYTFEFHVATDGEMPAQLPRAIGFEVQAQGRKRASDEFSDWAGVRSFCTMPEQVEDTSTVLVRAMVERGAAADAIKASLGYEEGLEELRFRVRGFGPSAHGAPSEPTEVLQMSTQALQGKSPPLPGFLGRGFFLLEDLKSKRLTHSEILHLSWPKPDLDLGDLSNGMPPLEYKLEKQHQGGDEEGNWESVPTAMLYTDRSSDLMSALVPMEQESMEPEECNFEHAEQECRSLLQTSPIPTEARFRLCADRPSSDVFKYEPVHSEPSDIFAWQLPNVPTALHVVGQSYNVVCLIFNWPRLSQASGGQLWACVESLSSLEDSEDGETKGESVIGLAPLVWQPAIDLQPLCKHYVSLDGIKDTATASQLVAKACAAATRDTCVSLIPLPESCTSGAGIRVRLQLSWRQAIHQSVWSKPFVLEEFTRAQKVRTLHLQYPGWMCVLPGLDETSGKFFPRLVLRETVAGQDPQETTLLDEASSVLENLQLNFEVVQGDLPACLLLDGCTGTISWRHALVDEGASQKSMESVMDSFAIQVSVTDDWSHGEQGWEVPSALCTSTVLHLAAAPSVFRGDDAAWEFIGGILKGPALEVLSERGMEALLAAAELLQDQELLEGFADFCEVLASDVGLPAFEIVMRILELPSEYMEHAADMDPDAFLDVICIALEASDSLEEEEGSRDRLESHDGLGDVDGSHADAQSADHLAEEEGFSDSSDEAPAGLVGQVRSDLGLEEGGLTDDDDDKKKSDELAKSPSTLTSSPSQKQRPSMFAALAKSVAALGVRRGSVTGRRNSALAGRRASRIQRRASQVNLHVEDDGSEPTNSTQMGRFRSIRRMSSHAANIEEGSPSHGTRLRSERLQRNEVEISYPTLLPLWPAFEELEFQPHAHAKKKLRRRSILHSATASGVFGEEASHQSPREALPQNVRYSISPGLPPHISFDESTGIIKGCPLMEHVAGCTYTISVWDRSSEDLLGKCSVAFAVAPAEVAKLCNAAFTFTQDASAAREENGYPGGAPSTPSTR